MIKKLRRKFILISSLITFLVLYAIIGIINLKNYLDIGSSADQIISILEHNNGTFPTNPKQNAYLKETNEPNPPPKGDDNINKETPFQTRYFTVSILDGTIDKINLDNIASISESQASEIASDLYLNNRQSGYYDVYRYKLCDLSTSQMYIFVDCRMEFETFHSFLFTSLLISLIGYIIVLTLLILFSFLIFKPVQESYLKQKQFITDANHELKTPLTIIDANCEVLEIESGPNQWLNSIKTEVQKMTKLTNNLVFLSRIDEENKNFPFSSFSLSEVIEEYVNKYEIVFKNQNKKFNATYSKSISFNGNLDLIKQMFSILFDNANKYCYEDGDINLVVSNTKNLKINFSNKTSGVNKGNLDILFERFYRLESSRNSSFGGSGIGLSILKEIVLIHKGKIKCFSLDGIYIIFEIIF